MDAVTSCSLAVGPGTLRSARSRARPTREERQQAQEHGAPVERVGHDAPAMAGPISPGTTHAVESIANIRGRSDSGIDRPIAT